MKKHVESRWTILGPGKTRGKNRTYRCRCLCGTERDVRVDLLKKGKSISCGCFAVEERIARQTTHGEGRAQERTKEYKTWSNMISRCENENDISFRFYGAALGVRVAEVWRRDYSAFLRDMGRAPTSEHSIDRIENSLGYRPGNCRWATAKEQANNKTSNVFTTIDGTTKTLTGWAEHVGCARFVIHNRYKRGLRGIRLIAPVRVYQRRAS